MIATRRGAIAGVACAAVSAAVGGCIGDPGRRTGSAAIRRDVTDAMANHPDELARFAAAMAAFKAAEGGAAWSRHAATHVYYCGGVAGAVHKTWWFYPWHRAFLYMTERNLRLAARDDGVAIPYWDWPRSLAVPAPFRSGALAHPRNDAVRLDPAEADYTHMRLATSFCGRMMNRGGRPRVTEWGFGGYSARPSFASILESAPHGVIHNALGGDMANFSWSPRDPLFYAHHANLDRLWSIWRGPPGSPRRAGEPWSDPAIAAMRFPFFELGAGAPRIVTIAEIMAEMDAIGYAPSAAARDAVEPNAALLGEPLSIAPVPVTLIPRTDGMPAHRAVLTLAGARVRAHRGLNVAAYLARDAGRNALRGDSAYVGLMAVTAENSQTAADYALDASAALARLGTGEHPLALILRPLRPRGGESVTAERCEIAFEA